jgi:aldose 1-epimerase
MGQGHYSVLAGDGPLGGYVLRDDDAGATARVLPEVGANCVQFSVPGPDGRLIDILRTPESAEALRAAPARSGLPLLFPFPNRIRQGRYTFQGTSYQLPQNSRGQAIHGLVIAARFRVEAAEATAEGAHLRCVIAHADLPDAAGYPFPFRFVVDYYLRSTALTLTVSATNEGDAAMPFGFGIHPYLNAPLSPQGRHRDCLISAPVSAQWELDATLVPTGRRVPLAADHPLRTLAPFADRTYDDVYTGIATVDGWSTCRLVDPAVPMEVAVEADANFREIVVYAPPGQDVVCFEPYTCTTDAFNLNERGVDGGRLILESGGRWAATIRIAAGPA